MDSLSQIALGAAVSVAVMGRRTPLAQAALWGAVCGTLPDLDALLDHGDAVRNMTLHRAETHALFWLTLVAPLIAAGIHRLNPGGASFKRWWLAVWLVLITHPLLDVMTVYGTRLALPFTDQPYGVGSIFIIDPLYTLPLLLGLGLTLYRKSLHANLVGLVASTLYLTWGYGAQQQVRGVAEASLQDMGVPVQRLLVTPTAFNSVLWRVVAITPDGYLEGFRSLLDREPHIHFERYPRGMEWYEPLADHDPVQRIVAFSRGYFDLVRVDDSIRIRDLRMGQTPYFFFSFIVAEQGPDGLMPVQPLPVGDRPPVADGLRWMRQRLLGRPLPSPGTELRNADH